MNTEEIIKALRAHSQNLVAYKLGCEFADSVEAAANLIESLQAQLEEFKAFHEKFGELEAREYGELYDKYAASQARERAAARDIHLIEHSKICDVCEFQECDVSDMICRMCVGKNADVGNFVWRGLREGAGRVDCKFCDDDFKFWQAEISGSLPNVRYCPMCGRKLEGEA